MDGQWVGTMSHYFWSQSSTGNMYMPPPRAIFGVPQKKATNVDLSNSRLSREWTESIDREWLRVSRKMRR